ncbi:hypothetical protein QIA17_00375 (plasmid) [Borreliella californiensis]|uniref:Uncharacterized protein n=1 Tax=Borreliella californiensis TaxID=373543 RepID=A0A7X0DRM3_9SPIR|nr:hypothetical protein [Borreliella californiensis]MBB6213389.1 hypothetical protein [Borreliella californiensis]MBB6213452.1 hypothetical protein [Borreliella californiensis]WKC91294.1 hypothetical protein QIA17_00375 [Borreliella californiensis]WNY70954.1 hypothetical protein QIA39_04620 [Borreliella californiensis]
MSDNNNAKSNFQDFKFSNVEFAKELSTQIINSALEVETNLNKILNTNNLHDAHLRVQKLKSRLVSTVRLAKKLNNHLLLEFDKISDFDIPVTLRIVDKILKVFYWTIVNFDSHTVSEIDSVGLKEINFLHEDEEGIKSAEEEISSIKNSKKREFLFGLLLVIKSTFQADKALIKAIRASLLASAFIAQQGIEGKQILFFYV